MAFARAGWWTTSMSTRSRELGPAEHCRRFPCGALSNRVLTGGDWNWGRTLRVPNILPLRVWTCWVHSRTHRGVGLPPIPVGWCDARRGKMGTRTPRPGRDNGSLPVPSSVRNTRGRRSIRTSRHSDASSDLGQRPGSGRRPVRRGSTRCLGTPASVCRPVRSPAFGGCDSGWRPRRRVRSRVRR